VALYQRGGVWWYEFIFAGKRVRESANTRRKTLAAEAEKSQRLELERAYAGRGSCKAHPVGRRYGQSVSERLAS